MGWRAVLGTRLRLGSGLGLHRQAEGAPRHPDRALREGAARERQALRRRAHVPPPQPRAPRRARVPGAHGAGGVRRPGRGPRRLLDGLRDDRALRLRLHGDVLRDAHRRRERDHAPRDPRARRQVHPAAQLGQDRHPLLLRPRDGLPLLVPDLLGRGALQRRVQGPQEGLVDDLGRVRRLLRRADDEPRLHRLRRPLRLRRRRRAHPGPSVAVGRARAAGQPVGADRDRQRRDPGRAARGPDGRRCQLQRRVGRPLVPGRLLLGLERPRPRRDRHRQAPHDPQEARGRRACGSPTTPRSRTTSARP